MENELAAEHIPQEIVENELVAEHIPQEIENNDSDEDWQMVPDGDGNMHLMNIKKQVEDIEPAFNAWVSVRFLLFTRNNRFEPQQIALNNGAQLSLSHFNPAHQTRYIIFN